MRSPPAPSPSPPSPTRRASTAPPPRRASRPSASGTLAGTDTGAFTQTFDTADTGTGKTLTPAGSVLDGNAGANYAITFVNDTTGVITGRAITVTATSDTKIYDATTSSAAIPTITSGALARWRHRGLHADLRHRQHRNRQDPDAGRHGDRRQQRRQLHHHVRQRHHRRHHRPRHHGDRDHRHQDLRRHHQLGGDPDHHRRHARRDRHRFVHPDLRHRQRRHRQDADPGRTR